MDFRKIVILLLLIIAIIAFAVFLKPQYVPLNQIGYAIGRVKLNMENPTIVDISHVSFDNQENDLFICEDSVAIHYNDSGWVSRSDVYGYMLVPFYDELFENARIYPITLQQRTRWFDKRYSPFFLSETMPDGACFYKFLESPNQFDVYLFAYDLEYVGADDDWSIPKYSSIYKLFLRPHYNIFEILHLKRLWREEQKTWEVWPN